MTLKPLKPCSRLGARFRSCPERRPPECSPLKRRSLSNIPSFRDAPHLFTTALYEAHLSAGSKPFKFRPFKFTLPPHNFSPTPVPLLCWRRWLLTACRPLRRFAVTLSSLSCFPLRSTDGRRSCGRLGVGALRARRPSLRRAPTAKRSPTKCAAAAIPSLPRFPPCSDLTGRWTFPPPLRSPRLRLPPPPVPPIALPWTQNRNAQFPLILVPQNRKT